MNLDKGTVGEKEVLIFLHLPKSGGTTLHSIIDTQYSPQHIYTIEGTRTRESLKEFINLPETERARFQVVRGHMPFGVHRYVPHPFTYITFLRDPVDRAISHYYHILRTPHHTHFSRLTSQKMDLDTFMHSGVSRIPDNGQVRMLAASEEVPFGQCTAEMLEKAKANLEQYFAVVGITERFDESLVLLMRRFGWHIKAYARRNIGKNRMAKEDVPQKTLHFIEELNKFDLQLYAYAQQRLDTTIKSIGIEFSRDLLKLRLMNSVRHRYAALRKCFR